MGLFGPKRRTQRNKQKKIGPKEFGPKQLKKNQLIKGFITAVHLGNSGVSGLKKNAFHKECQLRQKAADCAMAVTLPYRGCLLCSGCRTSLPRLSVVQWLTHFPSLPAGPST